MLNVNKKRRKQKIERELIQEQVVLQSFFWSIFAGIKETSCSMGKTGWLSEQSSVVQKSKSHLKSRDVTGLSKGVRVHEGRKEDCLGDGELWQISFQQIERCLYLCLVFS